MKVSQAKPYNPMDAESIARADIKRTLPEAASCVQTAQRAAARESCAARKPLQQRRTGNNDNYLSVD
jgi:hypothetical protein